MGDETLENRFPPLGRIMGYLGRRAYWCRFQATEILQGEHMWPSLQLHGVGRMGFCLPRSGAPFISPLRRV